MKMKKFRHVPAIVTLTAGFIACLVLIVNKYAFVDFLWILVLTMSSFFVLGLAIAVILNKVFHDEELKRRPKLRLKRLPKRQRKKKRMQIRLKRKKMTKGFLINKPEAYNG